MSTINTIDPTQKETDQAYAELTKALADCRNTTSSLRVFNILNYMELAIALPQVKEGLKRKQITDSMCAIVAQAYKWNRKLIRTKLDEAQRRHKITEKSKAQKALQVIDEYTKASVPYKDLKPLRMEVSLPGEYATMRWIHLKDVIPDAETRNYKHHAFTLLLDYTEDPERINWHWIFHDYIYEFFRNGRVRDAVQIVLAETQRVLQERYKKDRIKQVILFHTSNVGKKKGSAEYAKLQWAVVYSTSMKHRSNRVKHVLASSDVSDWYNVAKGMYRDNKSKCKHGAIKAETRQAYERLVLDRILPFGCWWADSRVLRSTMLYRAFQALNKTKIEVEPKEKWTPDMAKGKHSLRDLFLRFIDPNSKATPQAHKNRRGRCSHALERAVELGLLDPYYFDKTLQDFSTKKSLMQHLESLYGIVEKVKGPQDGKYPFSGKKSLEEFRAFIDAIERLCPMMAYLSEAESIKELDKLLKDRNHWFKNKLSIKVKTARCPLPELEEDSEPEVKPEPATCTKCNEVVCSCVELPEDKPEISTETDTVRYLKEQDIVDRVKRAIDALYDKVAECAKARDDKALNEANVRLTVLQRKFFALEDGMSAVSKLEDDLKKAETDLKSRKKILAKFIEVLGKEVDSLDGEAD